MYRKRVLLFSSDSYTLLVLSPDLLSGCLNTFLRTVPGIPFI